MLAFFLRKLIWAIATLAVASVLVFAALEIVPGDPAEVMLGINATDDAIAALRESLGLNKPVLERYISWLGWHACRRFWPELHLFGVGS